MPAIRIKVGASADASLRDVFRPIEEAAKRSRRVVINETKATARGAEAATKDGARAQMKAWEGYSRYLSKQAKDNAREHDKSEKEKTKSTEREAKARLAAEMKIGREYQSGMARLNKQMASQDKAFVGKLKNGAAMGGQVAMRGGKLALGMGRRVAESTGVDFDLGNAMSQQTKLQAAMSQLSNSGFMEGNRGASGTRQDPKAMGEELMKVATDTGYSFEEASRGLSAFVAKTGDLALGRDIMKDMSVLARATGTDLGDMVDAAGDVSNALGDMPNKGKAIDTVMAHIAQQGKLGAVEIKDLASQMAKVAAASQQFGGDKMRNIAFMGALAQSGRAEGGAASASQAATGVQSFVAQFSKGKRVENMQAMGAKYQNDKTGELLDPQTIITNVLEAAMKAGGVSNMRTNVGKMIADQQARKVINPSVNIFNRAYAAKQGTQQEKLAAGTEAVNKNFEKLNASMSDIERIESFKRAMQRADIKAQQFNNNLSKVSGDIQGALLPALEALAPMMLKAAGAAASFISVVMGKGPDNGKTAVEKGLAAGNAVATMQSIAMAQLSPEEASRRDALSKKKPWQLSGGEKEELGLLNDKYDAAPSITQDNINTFKKLSEDTAKSSADLTASAPTSTLSASEQKGWLKKGLLATAVGGIPGAIIANKKHNDAEEERRLTHDTAENLKTNSDRLAKAVEEFTKMAASGSIKVTTTSTTPVDPNGVTGNEK